MTSLIVVLTGVCVASLVAALLEHRAARSPALHRQLQALVERDQPVVSPAAAASSRHERVQILLDRLGAPLLRGRGGSDMVRLLLVRAGYRGTQAMSVFWGARVAGAGTGAALALLLPAFAGASGGFVLFSCLWFAAFGWIAPVFFLRLRARARQREIQRTLPDALDLLVVCVEAGLGLNQALLRVADEVRHFSPAVAGELSLVNLEMRAGVPRSDALRHLGERMQVDDLRSLASMLVQADRFGTSIGQALRVHSDTARNRRRQRTEEAAAKTTVKLVLPLALCIFPALFVVVLGPAVLGLIEALKGM